MGEGDREKIQNVLEQSLLVSVGCWMIWLYHLEGSSAAFTYGFDGIAEHSRVHQLYETHYILYIKTTHDTAPPPPQLMGNFYSRYQNQSLDSKKSW